MEGQSSPFGAISDSSPLVHYARIGRLDLIQGVFGEVAVPEAVWSEVVEEGLMRAGSPDVATAAWIHRISVTDSVLLDDLHTQLDPGESEAIALAHALSGSIPLIVDEKRARSIARSLGLQIVGSAGLLLLAKKQGLVPAVDTVLRQLVRSGFRLNDEILALVLTEAGEL